MAIAHVQSGGASAATFTFGSTVGIGNTVCVSVFSAGSTSAVSLTDDKSNTYTQVTNATTAGEGIWVFFAANVTNGPKTLTATSTGGSISSTAGDEFSGVSNQQDGHNAATGAPVSSTGNWTTSVNGDLIWGGVGFTAGTIWSAGSGFTIGYTSTIAGTLYQVQSAASSLTAVRVSTSQGGWIAGFSLKPIPTFALAANDAVETAAFAAAVRNPFTLAANDVVETASFTIIDENFIALAANDVVEMAAFDVVVIPANTSGYSIIPLTGI